MGLLLELLVRQVPEREEQGVSHATEWQNMVLRGQGRVRERDGEIPAAEEVQVEAVGTNDIQ